MSSGPDNRQILRQLEHLCRAGLRRIAASIFLRRNNAAREANGPGAYNFLDALVVGCKTNGPSQCGSGHNRLGLTATEQQTHMSLWVALASPLLLGFNITEPVSAWPKGTLEILTNPEVRTIEPLARSSTTPLRAAKIVHPKDVLRGRCWLSTRMLWQSKAARSRTTSP